MVKAIFVDLDATLLNDDKTICQKNVDAILKAEQNNIKFLFCTGRIPFCYTQYNYLNLTDYIASNGGVIIKDNRIISARYLTNNVKEKVLEYAIKHNSFLRIFTYDHLYLVNAESLNMEIKPYPNTVCLDHKEAREIIDDINVCKFTFIDKSNKTLKEVEKTINEMNIDSEMSYSNANFLEVTCKGINKGEGIKEYCRLRNIDIKDTIGIGDNDNDTTMLKTVGISACPKNAIDDIKQMVDYVSEFDNNNGAVADIIEKYGYK